VLQWIPDAGKTAQGEQLGEFVQEGYYSAGLTRPAAL
jgi:hypothetical protein